MTVGGGRNRIHNIIRLPHMTFLAPRFLSPQKLLLSFFIETTMPATITLVVLLSLA